MKEIKAIIQPGTLDAVIHALKQIPDLPGITVSEVKGFGRSRAVDSGDKVIEGANEYAKKVKLELVVPDEMLEWAVQVIQANAHWGKPGDGKIFISTVDDVVKVRTGERPACHLRGHAESSIQNSWHGLRRRGRGPETGSRPDCGWGR